MKPGYKQTDLGVLPEEWEVKTLGEIGSPVIGLTYDPSNINDDGVLVLRSSNIQNEELDLDNQVRVKMPIPEKTYVQEDDLLICVRNGSRSLIGKCLLLDKRVEGAAFGAFMSVYRSPINKFIVHVFKSHIIAKQIEENLGATINSINNKDLSSYKIPLPPPAEQQTIAEVLGAMDALLTAQRGLLAKKRDLKQAAQQALLSGETRLPGFAEEWDTRTLKSEIESLESGVSVNSISEEGNPQIHHSYILKTSAAFGGVFRSYEAKRIVDNDLSRARLNPSKDSIIISRMNTIDLVGECAYIDKNYPNLFIPDRLWQTRLFKNSRVSTKWLAFVLSSEPYKRLLKDIATGTSGSMKNIAQEAFLAIEVAFPAPDEQRAIADILSNMDVELEALAAQVAKTQALKQGMMHDLLTGAVRLTPATAASSTTLTPSTAA